MTSRVLRSPVSSSAAILVSALLVFSSRAALAQFTQQGSKLVGTGASEAHQGYSVALSGDGNTAIIGGPQDNEGAGAAWVFIRAAGVWTQKTKLVGTGAVGPARQGQSVALSFDGNTAIVGGYYDNGGDGAAWVFTRDARGVWKQQAKLVGSGALSAEQGSSVTLSGDGNTAIIGGPKKDKEGAGAAWVFTRDAQGGWSQIASNPPYLVGTGIVGAKVDAQGRSVALSYKGDTAIVAYHADFGQGVGQGGAFVFDHTGGKWHEEATLVSSGAAPGDPFQRHTPVALSLDGQTAIVGGPLDRQVIGAAWVFKAGSIQGPRTIWKQQAKLVGSGALSAEQGSSVTLSGDGNTAIIGGPQDNGGAGAAWVFTRRGDTWTQLATKLVAKDFVGVATQGQSVALSLDGNTAIVGGDSDSGGVGAAWVYVRQ